ncbi:MAG TPA: tRNA (5-methylaminomethyl-2-thiouridine)(34)-methyltransferase MnmD [Clostridiaceae bacterium]|nr:tRNA (5-methylaminomethyl-2-thiouridine)(34)-methyltransferase MnmD [Clostridiaceae bacterium]
MEIPLYLVNEHFDDRYFDVVNALDEAQQVFFKNNYLIERITSAIASNVPLRIGETGFGAGRSVVSLMEYIKKSGLSNISIEYYTVELYPLTPERMQLILSGFKDRVGEEIDVLVEAYKSIDTNIPGWHTMNIRQSFGTIRLSLWIGEALEMVEALELPCDVWFLDGHGPKKNPSMWRPELLMAVGKKTRAGGSCATFTVAGEVRRALMEAGFTINRLPGCNGKKMVLQGIKIN